jgi:DNA primase
VVTPAKNLWHCFGCGAGGGPIDWVMKSQGVSFRHAVELLREGLPLEAPLQAVKESTVRKLAAPVSIGAEDQVLLNQVIGYYHETLKAAPEALAYLKSRGIDHPEAIEKHRLGRSETPFRMSQPTAIGSAALFHDTRPLQLSHGESPPAYR